MQQSYIVPFSFIYFIPSLCLSYLVINKLYLHMVYLCNLWKFSVAIFNSKGLLNRLNSCIETILTSGIRAGQRASHPVVAGDGGWNRKVRDWGAPCYRRIWRMDKVICKGRFDPEKTKEEQIEYLKCNLCNFAFQNHTNNLLWEGMLGLVINHGRLIEQCTCNWNVTCSSHPRPETEGCADWSNESQEPIQIQNPGTTGEIVP